MRKQFKMALAIVLAVGGMVGVAAPAAAAQDGNPGPWEMPDVRGEILQRAINSVLDVTGDVDLDLELHHVPALGSADDAGSDILGLLVQRADVAGVVVVVDDLVAVCHDLVLVIGVAGLG